MTVGGGKGTFQYRTARAAVAGLLRSEILLGRIPPGTRLLQNEIAEQFETSTTPVREALRQLVAEGLLDGDPHRGVVVHQTSVEELEELYELRLVLEPMAIAATAQNITDEEMEQVEALMAAMEAETDVGAWIDLNGAFHVTLADAAHKPNLAAILHNLRNLSALYIAGSMNDQPDRVEVANREHRALVDAIRAKDVAKAQAAEQEHLQHTLELGRSHLGV